MENAYYRKDRKTWTYRFRFPENGGATHTKGGYATRKAALAAAREHLNAFTLGAVSPKGSPLTVDALWTLYIQYCRDQGQTKDWLYSKEKSFFRHFKSLRVVPAHTVTPHQLQACITGAQDIGPYMRGELVKIVKAFLRWAHQQGYLPTDPSARLERPQGHQHHPGSWKGKPFPAEADIAALVSVATQDEQDQILIGRHTGSEPASLRRMVWGDVDFERRELKVSRKKNRSASLKYHTVPLSDEALACLRRRFAMGPAVTELIFPTILTEMRWVILKRKAQDSTGRPIQFGRAVFKHMFRTAVANAREPRPLTVPEIEAVTGCSYSTLAKHYIQTDPQSARDVIGRLFGGSERPARQELSALPDDAHPDRIRECIIVYGGANAREIARSRSGALKLETPAALGRLSSAPTSSTDLTPL